jgi:hypothetical protein
MDAALALSDLIDSLFDFDCEWNSVDVENLDTLIRRVDETWHKAFQNTTLNLARPKYHSLTHIVKEQLQNPVWPTSRSSTPGSQGPNLAAA